MSQRGRAALFLILLPLLAAACAGVTTTPVGVTVSPLPVPSTGSASPAPGTPGASASAPGAPGKAGTVPSFRHVYLIVLENEEYSSLVGSSQAPYLNGLIARYGLATNYFAVAHPSQPNYLALFSGSTQGVSDDSNHDLAGKNLADQLDAAGKTWAVFAQDYPGGCFTGSTSNGSGEGYGVAGSYARKHDPAISFTDISSSPARCARISNLAALDPARADFEMIVPNQCNDMHSCSIGVGDSFLKAFVPHITSSPDFAGSVIFITTDEGKSDANGGGQVATIVVSPLVRAGFTSATQHNHYSLLRTIEEAWGLPCLGQSCSANDLAEFFNSQA